jgi:opacity protein-like surface antigen
MTRRITLLLCAFAAAASPAAAQTDRIGVFGVGQFGYMRFAAEKSFDAVLGTTGGVFGGGGAEFRVGNVFLNASIDRFRKIGQRVVVVDGELFKLGIEDTVTVIPVAVSAGWRFTNERATPYVGGGVGRMLYREDSKFVDPDQNVRTQYSSYHIVAGVEFRNEWVATAFEVQYTRAPRTIGVGGASAAFQETDLGGLTGRIRILFGH